MGRGSALPSCCCCPGARGGVCALGPELGPGIGLGQRLPPAVSSAPVPRLRGGAVSWCLAVLAASVTEAECHPPSRACPCALVRVGRAASLPASVSPPVHRDTLLRPHVQGVAWKSEYLVMRKRWHRGLGPPLLRKLQHARPVLLSGSDLGLGCGHMVGLGPGGRREGMGALGQPWPCGPKHPPQGRCSWGHPRGWTAAEGREEQ